jgi:hypothetical protein
MSADNGIYILTTPIGPYKEYRVAHLGAIDNLDWDHEKNKSCLEVNEPRNRFETVEDYRNRVRIINAKDMFKNAKMFRVREEADAYAKQLFEDLTICEYGICQIEIPLTFYSGWEAEMDGLSAMIDFQEKECRDEWRREYNKEQSFYHQKGPLTDEELADAAKWAELFPGPYAPCTCDKCGIIWDKGRGLDAICTNTNSIDQRPIATEEIVAMKRKLGAMLMYFPRILDELAQLRKVLVSKPSLHTMLRENGILAARGLEGCSAETVARMVEKVSGWQPGTAGHMEIDG